MNFNFWIRNSSELTFAFFSLVVVAVVTQLGRDGFAKSIPIWLRAPVKAAPAFFLAVLCWYLHLPGVIIAGFFLCGIGDILLDLPKGDDSLAFKVGAGLFAAALVCFSYVNLGKPMAGHILWPLSLTNIAIAIFILRWVLPKITGTRRVLEVTYFLILIASNVIASTSVVPIFLGSSLWLMADLSIGIRDHITETPTNSLDTLGLYDVGLYFIAIGYLNF